MVGRYGGDEFVVLLPGADAAGGRVVADRIAAAVPDALLDRRRAVGASRCRPTSCCDRADRALLLAKRTGKQRVAVAGADLEQELELVEARAGSPEATMREFWEMVAASESSRETLLTLPAFVRRAIGAEEVALYELEGDERARRRPSRAAPATREPTTFEVERVHGDRRDARAARARRDLAAHAGRPAGRDRRRGPARGPRRARPAPTPSCRCCGPGARTA